MSNNLIITMKIPQPTIKVDVAYYNETEKQKFLKYPSSIEIEKIVRSGLEIPTEEFLTYYLFHKKRPGKEGWRNYSEVGTKIGHALAELVGWVNFNGESISTPPDVAGQDRTITECIGESIGLSVVSKIHGLTAADWDRIPIIQDPSFDYQIASDGKSVIQMEAKGSSAVNNAVKTPSVSNHKANIIAKKQTINKAALLGTYSYPADLRYGVITVMGEAITTPVKCLLVDPPANSDGGSPQSYRLVQRMRFLRDWITFISPRSQLATALQTRFASLESMPDPFVLDGIPLLKGNGEPFDFTPIGRAFSGHSSYFATRSTISDGPAGGIVVPLPDGDLFFLGIRENLLEQASKQQMRNILEYKTDHGRINKTVNCVVTERAFEEFRLFGELTMPVRRANGYCMFKLSGEIQYSDSGILFGKLPTHP